jgi:sulfonate transport system ATP-binding protein
MKKNEYSLIIYVEEILSLLGLREVRKAYPHDLSASTEQHIVIGQSFALHPDLLLMDEPYAQVVIKKEI